MTAYVLTAIAASAAVTYFLRALPFIFFKGNKRMPRTLEKLGQVLPSAIMAVLIVYCLKGAKSDFKGVGLPAFFAVAAVVAIHKLRHNTFLSIMVGTVVYMALIRVL